MAGHPTIGTAHALAANNIITTTEGSNAIVLEELVGEIPVTVYKENQLIIKCEMEQPLAEFGEVLTDVDVVAKLLSISTDDLEKISPIQSVSSGVPFLFIPIRSLAAIQNIKFRMDIWEKHFGKDLNRQNIVVFTIETVEENADVHSRMFAPALGITEDPATGSASGPLGAYLIKYGLLQSEEDGVFFIRGEQGFEMGRPSQIDITIEKRQGEIQRIKVGGPSVIMGAGEVYLSI